MGKGILCLLWHVDEFLQKGVLRNSVWLGYEQVVTIREEIKSVLQEILASRLKRRFHAEQGNCECVLGFLRRFWH